MIKNSVLDAALTGSLLILLIAILSFLFVDWTQPTRLVMQVQASQPARLEVAYGVSRADESIKKPNVARARLGKADDFSIVEFRLPREQLQSLRVNLGNTAETLAIKYIALKGPFEEYRWSPQDIPRDFAPSPTLLRFEAADQVFYIQATQPGAYFQSRRDLSLTAAHVRAIDPKLILLALTGPALLVCLKLFRAIRARRRALLGLKQISFARASLNRSTVLIGLLLGYGAFRLLSVAAHAPLIGYANNGDFGRIQACFGLESAVSPLKPGEGSTAAPVSEYRLGGLVDRDYCYLSSESLFVLVSLTRTALMNAPANLSSRTFDLRELGLLQAILLIGSGFGLTFLYKRISNRLALVSASIFALLIADPANSLYLNTFYSEFASLLSAYLSLGLLFYLVLTHEWSNALLLTLALSLFVLGTSKVQTFLLPLVLSGALLLFSLLTLPHRVSRGRILFGVILLFSITPVIIRLQDLQQDRPGYMSAVRLANATDLLFGTLLSAMNDPRVGLDTLGLPQRCIRYVGKTYYDPGMRPPPCRAILSVGRERVLELLAQEPLMFARVASNALAHTRPWIVDYLGQIEGETFGKVDTKPPFATWSVAALVDAIPQPIYFLLVALALPSTLVSISLVLYSRFRPLDKVFVQLSMFQLFMMTVSLYAFVSSLLGEGLIDFAKHFYIGQIPLALATAGWMAQLYLLLGRIVNRGRSKAIFLNVRHAATARSR